MSIALSTLWSGALSLSCPCAVAANLGWCKGEWKGELRETPWMVCRFVAFALSPPPWCPTLREEFHLTDQSSAIGLFGSTATVLFEAAAAAANNIIDAYMQFSWFSIVLFGTEEHH